FISNSATWRSCSRCCHIASLTSMSKENSSESAPALCASGRQSTQGAPYCITGSSARSCAPLSACVCVVCIVRSSSVPLCSPSPCRPWREVGRAVFPSSAPWPAGVRAGGPCASLHRYFRYGSPFVCETEQDPCPCAYVRYQGDQNRREIPVCAHLYWL